LRWGKKNLHIILIIILSKNNNYSKHNKIYSSIKEINYMDLFIYKINIWINIFLLNQFLFLRKKFVYIIEKKSNLNFILSFE
jgi:hypothetical protein